MSLKATIDRGGAAEYSSGPSGTKFFQSVYLKAESPDGRASRRPVSPPEGDTT